MDAGVGFVITQLFFYNAFYFDFVERGSAHRNQYPGPIAAFVVELFPTRIRYTSMSLPYHIGNGWFGGLLPLIATALVAAKGDIYYGLWYPIVVAAMTFVIGSLFVRETKHHRIRDTF